MNDENWYLKLPGEQPVGPGTAEQLKDRIRQGNVSDTAMVALEGSGDWYPINDVPEFSDVREHLQTFAPASLRVNENPFAQAPVQMLEYAASSANRVLYIVLAFFLGTFGIHNFYGNRPKAAKVQLILGIVGYVTSFIFVGVFIVIGLWIYNIYEMVTVTTDEQGRRFQ